MKLKGDLHIKFGWKPIYTLVLLLNLIYIIIFYLVMTSNA
jgi:hypothetical protein